MSTESPTSLEQISSTLLRIKKILVNFLDIDERTHSIVNFYSGRNYRRLIMEVSSVNWQLKHNIS